MNGPFIEEHTAAGSAAPDPSRETKRREELAKQ